MNHRVLELLKTPKNIQSEDLSLLKEEIDSFPYIQNIRALYLYGVHRYDKENYQKVLSTTAAYTTDKKILYQLINGKIQQRAKPEMPSESIINKPVSEEKLIKPLQQAKVSGFPLKREDAPGNQSVPEIADAKKEAVEDNEHTRILPEHKPEIKQVYVKGEKNRILFEGEENFLEDEDVETIDLESTLESGSIVTQKPRKAEVSIVPENKDQTDEKDPQVQGSVHESSEEFTPETIIEEEQITSEPGKEEVLNESALNFHETERFVPETQVQSNEAEKIQEPDAVDEHTESTDIPKPAEEFTPETVIEEEQITSEPGKEEVLDESALNFHETERFVPETQVQSNEAEEIQEPDTADDSVNYPDPDQQTGFTSEKVINEDEISSEKEKESVQDGSELSFHGMESFLPEVKIQGNNAEENSISEIPQANSNKHEDEMRRLIEEVEKKMKEKAASDTIKKEKEEEPENIRHDISFAETQSFEIHPSEPEIKDELTKEDNVSAKETEPEIIEERKVKEVTEKEKATAEVKSAWKPMSLESNLPDSLLSKPAEAPQPKAETPKPEIASEKIKEEEGPVQEGILPLADAPAKTKDLSEEPEKSDEEDQINGDEVPETESKEDVPVMNVSFFGSGWSIAQPEKNKQEDKEESQVKKTEEVPAAIVASNPADSNIPGFINTWQSWLKIDRTEEVEKEKVEIKTKVIEAFIEKNPRISQLKDEVNFVVKEKGDDISHLMTETLANLYIEQKLYTKAIKAFEILIGKMPEKEAYFKGRIQEIKDFRSNSK